MKRIGPKGVAIVKFFESCRLTPYLDGGGVPTDGWGNTHGVVLGKRITQEKADADLLRNLAEAETCVNTHAPEGCTQSQFDAACSLVFNIGTERFIDSTLLRLWRLGDIAGAAAQFVRRDANQQLHGFIFDNGVIEGGLVTRRYAERALFESADFSNVVAGAESTAPKPGETA